MTKKKNIDLVSTGNSIFIVFEDDYVELENGGNERVPYVSCVFETEEEAKEYIEFYNKKYNCFDYYYNTCQLPHPIEGGACKSSS